MEVILLERIEKLGQMGDVVNVRPGFARNYLLPQKKALRATDQNKQGFEGQRAQLEAENLDNKHEAEAVAARMEGLKIIIVRQASDNNQLYGSVTVRNISQGVTEAGFSVDSKQVQMGRPIKTIGLFDVTIRLHPEVSLTIIANVARSEEEALAQAEGRVIDPDLSTFDEDGAEVADTSDEAADTSEEAAEATSKSDEAEANPAA
jgi:large subunit ribosomal protein L9